MWRGWTVIGWFLEAALLRLRQTGSAFATKRATSPAPAQLEDTFFACRGYADPKNGRHTLSATACDHIGDGWKVLFFSTNRDAKNPASKDGVRVEVKRASKLTIFILSTLQAAASLLVELCLPIPEAKLKSACLFGCGRSSGLN